MILTFSPDWEKVSLFGQKCMKELLAGILNVIFEIYSVKYIYIHGKNSRSPLKIVQNLH